MMLLSTNLNCSRTTLEHVSREFLCTSTLVLISLTLYMADDKEVLKMNACARIISTPRAGYIQASRALMITSTVLGTCGLLAALIGVKCSKAGGENYVLKGRIAGTAGVLFILQGNKKIGENIRPV